MSDIDVKYAALGGPGGWLGPATTPELIAPYGVGRQPFDDLAWRPDMPVTMQQVLAEIDREEPDYAAFPKLGPEVLPHLQMIVAADDSLKAAKAAYAASLIGGPVAIELLQIAAGHQDPRVRIAVADGLQHLAAVPIDLVMNALNDPDAGVRKLALITTGLFNRADFAQRVAGIAQEDPADHLGPSVSARGIQPRSTDR